MKEGKIHVCFVLDASGSMFGSKEDVVGGFNKTIEEQRAIKDGECVVSLFTFNDNVKQVFLGRNLDEIKPLTCDNHIESWSTLTCTHVVLSNNGATYIDNQTSKTISNEDEYNYSPNGLTAMNDGIGTAIDAVGKWLADMPEEERPSKNLIVVMTDGMENASKEYTLAKVREMIKHQTDVYNWSFVYMGTDITTVDTAEGLGINTRSFSSRASSDTFKNYSNISLATSAYRSADSLEAAVCALDTCLTTNLTEMTKSYEATTGIKIEK